MASPGPAVQEIQSLVCCYLHEAFIADPNLAKLVHFQVEFKG